MCISVGNFNVVSNNCMRCFFFNGSKIVHKSASLLGLILGGKKERICAAMPIYGKKEMRNRKRSKSTVV